MDILTAYKLGKIDQFDYDTYLMFESNDIGRAYLKNMLEAIVLEEPNTTKSHSFAWVDGRRSVWRQIKASLNHSKLIMEGTTNEHSRHYQHRETNATNEPVAPLYEFHSPID
jgi:hypothetical protein